MFRKAFRTVAILAAFVAVGVSGSIALAAPLSSISYTCTNIGCSGTYVHTYTVTLLCDGTFVGTGYWNNDPVNYTETVVGRLSAPNVVDYVTTYTKYFAGYTVTVHGTVHPGTHVLTGTGVASVGQTFAVSGTMNVTFDPSSCVKQWSSGRDTGDRD